MVPAATEGFDGATEIELSAAAVIETETWLETPPKLAVMVACPAEDAVARPLASMETTPEFDDDHVTEEVMFCVEPSL